jgi:branched-chain amino acid transport system substrate-binding protein
MVQERLIPQEVNIMKNIRKYRYYVIFVMSLLIFGICGQGNTEADETLKIGVVAELTGAAAAWGLSVLHGVEWVVADAGSEIEVGGKKYKIEVIAYDGKYTGTDSVAALNRLLYQDKVKFIVGPIGSAPCMAMKPIVVKNKDKLIQLCNSFTPKLLDPSTENIFRVLMTPGEYSKFESKWISEWHDKNMKGKPKTYALMAANDESGWSSVKYYTESLESAGFKVVIKEFYERGTKDFVPLLTRIMATNPSYFDPDGASPGDTGVVVKQLRQMGFKGQITYSGGPGFEEVIRVAGKHAEGFIGWAPTNVEDPRIKALSDRHEKEFKRPMNLLFPNFYLAGEVLLAALKQTGTVDDIPKLIHTLETTKYETVLGQIKWVGKERYGIDRQILHDTYMGQIVGDTYKIIGTLK